MQCCSYEEDIVDAAAELSETSLATADTSMKENSNSMKENSNSDADCAKKTVKIQCLVERILKRTDRESTWEHRTEKDVEVTLPSEELFADVVQLVLEKLGYPNTEALGAKGFIEINKNWNLVPLDSATINKTATVSKMLGDVSGFAVIRIQLSNSSKVSALYEIQHNLLSYLLEKSQDLLQDAGCPLDQMALKQLTSGTFKEVLPDDMRIAFDRWYQTNREFGIPMRRSGDKLDSTQQSSDNRTISRSCRPEERTFSELVSSRLAGLLNKDTEIPKLEQWYLQNKFPSKAVMIEYLNKLNSQELRRSQKPPLELADVLDWFASRRNDEMIAEQKIVPVEMPEKSPSLLCATDNANIHHSRNTLTDVKMNGYPSKSSDEIVPVFANKNAVFGINPHRLSRQDSVGLEVLRENDKFNQELEHRSTLPDKSLNISESFVKRSRGQKRSSDENHNRFDLLTTNSQTEATDLSLRRPYDNASPQIDNKPSSVQLFLQNSSISQKRPRTLKSEKLNRGNMEGFLRSGSPSSFKPNVESGPNSPFSIHNVQKAQQMQMAAAYLQLQYMHQHSALFNPSYPSLPAFAQQGRVDEPTLSNGRGSERIKRSRIFIDPVTEIPKLEEWFHHDPRPSTHILEHYTKVLNSMPYRQQRTIILDPKNVQLWFKNHRAKIRNQMLQKERTSPPSSGGQSDGINLFFISPALSKYSETFKQENDDDSSDNSDGAPGSANSDGPAPCLDI